MPIRAIPGYGGADLYLDTSRLTHQQRQDLEAELKSRHYYIQYLTLEDPNYILIEAEIRQRIEAEQAAKK